jgi:predicted oxidoreductase
VLGHRPGQADPTGALSLSRPVLGCMRLADDPARAGERDIQALIEAALSVGITSLDHADIYGFWLTDPPAFHHVEALFGRTFAAAPGLRDRVEIVAKAGIVPEGVGGATVKHYDFSAAHLTRQIDASLAALKTDWIDLFLLHRPDVLIDAEETARALDDAVAAGKIRAVGVSNFTPARIDLLAGALGARLVAQQVELSVLAPEALEDGTIDHAVARGLTPMAWSPLGGQRLFSDPGAPAAQVRTALEAVARDHGLAGIDQAALAWLMSHPAGIVPVLGTSRAERLAPAVAAAHTPIERTAWYQVYQTVMGRPVP